MRVNLLNDYVDPTRGGIESTIYYLLVELGKQYQVGSISKPINKKYELNCVEYLEKEVTKKEFEWKRFRWTMTHSKKDENVVNIAMSWYAALPCLIAKKIYGTPYLVLAHGNEVYFINSRYTNLKERLKNIKRKIITKQIFNNASYVCCNSHFTASLVKNITVKCNISIIHPGMSLEAGGIDEQDQLDERFILSIGRLIERKGFQFMIQAMPKVKEKYKNVKYCIVGGGDYELTLRERVKGLGLERDVIFLGRVDEDKKQELLSKCSILVMPSIELPQNFSVEGFGIVYIEANRYGKYVIAADTGGVSDAVKDGITGVLLHAVDSNTLSNAVIEVLDHYQDIYTPEEKQIRIKWAEEHDYSHIANYYGRLISHTVK